MARKNKNVPKTFYESYDIGNPPRFKVGDYNIYGKKNDYDLLAIKKGVAPQTNSSSMIFPIRSGLTTWRVERIEKLWRPKEGARVSSWLHRGDYSDHPAFEQYWYVTTNLHDLFYELAWLIA